MQQLGDVAFRSRDPGFSSSKIIPRSRPPGLPVAAYFVSCVYEILDAFTILHCACKYLGSRANKLAWLMRLKVCGPVPRRVVHIFDALRDADD